MVRYDSVYHQLHHDYTCYRAVPEAAKQKILKHAYEP
jgi:hypothetical protein